ncbi:MAG TPA: hypothetical protein VFR56_12125 [Actinomycetes bacterium]|nr:hypothetical protein [Actinomycetes bacterium]
MSAAQNWTLLGMVTVLLGAIGGLVVRQVMLVGDRLEARIGGLESTTDATFTGLASAMDARFTGVASAMDARFTGVESVIDARFSGLESAMDARFAAMDQRFDHLDRDVEAIARIVFPRE